MPLIAFWIMPTEILVALLSLIGQKGPAFQAMGHAVEPVLAATYMVQNFEGGLIHASAPLGLVVGAFIAGGVVICKPGNWPRWLVLARFAVAILGSSLATSPDILAGEHGPIAAVRDENTLCLASTRLGMFEYKA